MKNVTVIGAGATGHALTAVLASKGHRVYLSDTEAYSDVLNRTREKGEIEVYGTVALSGRPEEVTTDIGRAVSKSELIVCCTVSGRDAEIAETISPYLNDKKAVLIGAGNGASIVYHKIFTEAGKGNVLVGEVAGNFFPCRLEKEVKVRIGLPLGPKKAAAFPVNRTEELVEIFKDVWTLEPCNSLFEALFNGPNIICHGAGIISNLAAIDRNQTGSFNLFKDGLSPAVINLTDALWEEKKRVYDAMESELPAPPRQMLEGVLDVTNSSYDSFREMDGPDSLEHRYISEDVPYLMCFFVSIARAMEVEVPLFEGIIKTVEKATGKEYYQNGRTLKNLGLDKLSKKELVEFFKIPLNM